MSNEIGSDYDVIIMGGGPACRPGVVIRQGLGLDVATYWSV